MTSARRWIAQGLRTPPTLRRHTWPFRTVYRTAPGLTFLDKATAARRLRLPFAFVPVAGCDGGLPSVPVAL